VKVGVVVFPGSNCDHDTEHVLRDVCGQDVRLVWHKDSDLSRPRRRGPARRVRLRRLPAHGRHRALQPVMKAVGEFARAGGPVLGICNGFQILQEAGLLPGRCCATRA
jgi:phosphoribosylformylglycinamidine synthase